MHECAHRLAFRRRRSSDLLGRRVLGPLALADFDAYRERHWAHHRNLGLDTDTKDAYLVDIRGAGILRLLVRCLSLREAVRKFTRQAPPPAADRSWPWATAWARRRPGPHRGRAGRPGRRRAGRGRPRPTTAWRASWSSAALAYGFVYLYGLAALTVFAATLRAVAEHQVGRRRAPSTRAGPPCATSRPGPFGRLVFGSYGFSNHATHHREPGVAHYRLATLTAGLAAAEPGLTPTGGYLSMLWRLGRAGPVDPRLTDPGQGDGCGSPPPGPRQPSDNPPVTSSGRSGSVARLPPRNPLATG